MPPGHHAGSPAAGPAAVEAFPLYGEMMDAYDEDEEAPKPAPLGAGTGTEAGPAVAAQAALSAVGAPAPARCYCLPPSAAAPALHLHAEDEWRATCTGMSEADFDTVRWWLFPVQRDTQWTPAVVGPNLATSRRRGMSDLAHRSSGLRLWGARCSVLPS
jgi:hypothetical protein